MKREKEREKERKRRGPAGSSSLLSEERKPRERGKNKRGKEERGENSLHKGIKVHLSFEASRGEGDDGGEGRRRNRKNREYLFGKQTAQTDGRTMTMLIVSMDKSVYCVNTRGGGDPDQGLVHVEGRAQCLPGADGETGRRRNSYFSP